MRYFTVVGPKMLQGIVQLPASKSISNRALILKALSKSPYGIDNLSVCDDTDVMVRAFSSDSSLIDIKAAGTAMRFLTAYLSQQPGEWIITGTERMKNRPVKILVEALRSLGAQIEYPEKEGFPPLKISGKILQGGRILLDGSVSSQYISALMMIAPVMQQGLILELQGRVISEPYIHLTKKVMEDFGVIVSWKNQEIRIASQNYVPVPFTVESDWSAASYWYQIVALSHAGTELELSGLRENSFQGDAKVACLFKELGVTTEFTPEGVRLRKEGSVTLRLNYDFVDQPDLAQTFVVTCALMNIPFHFSGLQSLRIKETDRIAALQNEMCKLGYIISDSGDAVMEWNGKRCPSQTDSGIDTYEDHRMAMAFAPASLVLGKININDPEVVSKSYPGYWEDLKDAGFEVLCP